MKPQNRNSYINIIVNQSPSHTKLTKIGTLNLHMNGQLMLDSNTKETQIKMQLLVNVLVVYLRSQQVQDLYRAAGQLCTDPVLVENSDKPLRHQQEATF